jgi:hypothetical protein
VFPVKLGTATFNASLKDIIYDAPKGGLPAPQHDDVQADGGRHGAPRAGVLLRSAAASSSGRAMSRPRRGSRSIPIRR